MDLEKIMIILIFGNLLIAFLLFSLISIFNPFKNFDKNNPFLFVYVLSKPIYKELDACFMFYFCCFWPMVFVFWSAFYLVKIISKLIMSVGNFMINFSKKIREKYNVK